MLSLLSIRSFSHSVGGFSSACWFLRDEGYVSFARKYLSISASFSSWSGVSLAGGLGRQPGSGAWKTPAKLFGGGVDAVEPPSAAVASEEALSRELILASDSLKLSLPFWPRVDIELYALESIEGRCDPLEPPIVAPFFDEAAESLERTCVASRPSVDMVVVMRERGNQGTRWSGLLGGRGVKCGRE